MNGEYKVTIPFEAKTNRRESSRGKTAIAWRRHWHNLRAICKSLYRAHIRYEVEYHFGAEVPYAVVLAGGACRQMELAIAA